MAPSQACGTTNHCQNTGVWQGWRQVFEGMVKEVMSRMSEKELIEYKKHSEIDRQRWDACIEGSVNRLPYALSWWLDTVCPDWDALVEDDYRAVMPLTRDRKFGFDYLYQPYFTQQLGVFSSLRPVMPEWSSQFLDAIPDKLPVYSGINSICTT